jgi:hypothetical protein
MRIGSGDFLYEVIPNGACDYRGRVYLFSRGSHPLLVFEPDGTILGSWEEGRFIRPQGIAYCPDETDQTVRKCILEGEVLMTLGSR